ncbi:MAG: DNA mismatch repair protein MutT [Draconibacterium sp.]|nr:MAG: DNA mismatch repair protein MutT [Draconibacterium sp.]PIF05552.1 MAG: DNA mismatch repair protein MutT [Draconibacterium sp.]
MPITHPFNVFKFCPKCGSPHFDVSGERAKKCKICNFHFYFNASAAVAALVTDGKGRLMLVKRGVEPHYGMLDLPGGFIDPGETAENAVKRELMEELGLKTKFIRYLQSAPNEYIFSDFSVFTLDMAYEVIPESLSGLKPMDDILDYHFYSSDEIDETKIAAPSIKKFVIDYFKK